MKAIITVVGKDMVGILSKVSCKCANVNINIDEVTQSVLKDMFAMIMLVDIENCSVDFVDFVEDMEQMGEKENLKIQVMHEDIFDAMHKI